MNSRLWIADCGLRIVVLSAAMVYISGCIAERQHPSATQPATFVNLATTQPSYWLDQPPTATVTGADFERLVKVCEDVSRDNFFKLDRTQYRDGVLTTEPLVSGQVFEPWRQDNRREYDVEESSIASIRRTIRFEFTRVDDGWQVTPKVLVERESIAEKRITSEVLYRSAFTQTKQDMHRPPGSHEADVGIILPERYWYVLRRDTEFERVVAAAMQKKLNKS